MKPRTSGLLWITLPILAACEREDPAQTPLATPSAAPVQVQVALPPLPERIRFRKEAHAQGVGLPAGCQLQLPTRAAPLPEGEVQFVTAPEAAEELLLGVKRAGEPQKAGVFPLDGATRGRQFPWDDLEAPPALSRADRGWLAAIQGTKGALESVVLWREGGASERLAEGDRLAASDLRCARDDCAILTSRVSKSAGSGASVFLGRANAPAHQWNRRDVTPDGADRTSPLAILDVSAGAARVALTAAKGIEVWNVSAGAAERSHTLGVEHAAFDVFLADVPVVVAAGESIEEPCRKDGFPLLFERADGQRFTVTVPVPPEELATRRLEDGFIVAWAAPISCRLRQRSVVHALLLDRRGEPRSSPMAVADGTGFALSTRGSAVDIWLQRGATLTWATGVCRLNGPSPSPPPVPSAGPAGSAFKSADK